MIKLVFCARRRSGLSRAEFQDYWLNHHGPLVRKNAQSYGILKYVQNHTLETPLNDNLKKVRGLSEEYDGIGEIWWESEEKFIETIRSEEGEKLRKVFLEDEAKFIDASRSSAFFTVERSLIDEGA